MTERWRDIYIEKPFIDDTPYESEEMELEKLTEYNLNLMSSDNKIDYERKQKSCPSCIHGRQYHMDYHWCTLPLEFESECISQNRINWKDKFPDFLTEEEMELL